MKRILVFQHVAKEVQGTLDPLMRARGSRIRYVNFGREPEAKPDVRNYNGLVVLGGPMGAYESEAYPHLDVEVREIETAIDSGIPVLGICLGAQLLARALGAEVYPNSVSEIGWYELALEPDAAEDPLFDHFDSNERLFQWHHDTFALPSGARRLATSQTCENQLFRYGPHAYGLQFHLEVDEALIQRWVSTPAYKAELLDRTTLNRVREETRTHLRRNHRLAVETFQRFFALGD